MYAYVYIHLVRSFQIQGLLQFEQDIFNENKIQICLDALIHLSTVFIIFFIRLYTTMPDQRANQVIIYCINLF